MLKACLFDLDGTLIDSERYYQDGTFFWLNRMGVKINKKDLCGIIGKDEKDTYNYLSKLTGLSYKVCEENNERYFKEEDPLDFNKYLYSDVKDAFKEIKEKGLLIAICSMSPYDYIKKCIKVCGLSEYVDYYVSGRNVKRNKPYPDIYLNALDELKIKSSEAIVIEDAESGIASGKAAGVKVIARDASRFYIDQSKADYILEDFKKLSKIIEEVYYG